MKWSLLLLALIALAQISILLAPYILSLLTAWAYGLSLDDFTGCYLPSAVILDVAPRCRETGSLGVASAAVQAGKWDSLVSVIVWALGVRELAGELLLPWWHPYWDNMAEWAGAGAAACFAVLCWLSFGAGALGSSLVAAWVTLRDNIPIWWKMAVAGVDACISTSTSVASGVVRWVGGLPIAMWSWLHWAIPTCGDVLLEAYRSTLEWILWELFKVVAHCVLVLGFLVLLATPSAEGRRGDPQGHNGDHEGRGFAPAGPPGRPGMMAQRGPPTSTGRRSTPRSSARRTPLRAYVEEGKEE
ncbi:MAG: hypothetical protein M1822_008662 [Bathelium mastoideum]|nr:MAG: hypothetical protein M1822_008662 [Bathelium mastoideum]